MKTRSLFRLLTPISRMVARQLAQPSGWFGRVVMTRVLNRGNRELITSTLDCLPLTPEARLLDVGFGGGLALELARKRGIARLWGLERSVAAIEQLTVKQPKWISDGTLSLHQGAVEQLPFDDGSFDAIISTNTVYFWPDLAAAFNQLRRVLAPGGVLALGFSSHQKLRSLATITQHGFQYYELPELLAQAENAGFTDIEAIELRGRDTTGDWVLRARVKG